MGDMTIYTDGGARGNPGPSAIALLVYDSKGKLVCSHSEYIGENTNNVAEYRAVLKALKMASKYGSGKVTCVMDSQLVMMQLSGSYRVRKPHLRDLFDMVKNEEKSFEKVSYSHVRREEKHISLADMMVNKVLDKVGG